MSLTRIVDGRLVPAAGTWQIDPMHTSPAFGVRHLLTRLRGRFREVAGTVVIADDPTASHVEVVIEAASIDTNIAAADDTLRGPDFLDVENHPTIAFTSTGVAPGPGDRWRVDGELTIRGVTNAVTLDTGFVGVATHPMGGQAKMSFEATCGIDRRDFGIDAWQLPAPDVAGATLVGNAIDITLDVEADRI